MTARFAWCAIAILVGRVAWADETCRYSGTTLTLARALPKGLAQCSVTYKNGEQIDGLPVIENISCK